MSNIQIPEHVRRIVSRLPGSRIGWRDRSIILLISVSGFKVAEIVSLDVERVSINSIFMEMTFLYPSIAGSSKRVVKIPREANTDFCPVHAVEKWLDKSEIKTGPLFQGLGSYGKLSNSPLSETRALIMISRNVRRAGLDPEQFDAEGLRGALSMKGGLDGFCS